MVAQGIAIIGGIIAIGLFLGWLSFQIKRFKALPFGAGTLLLLWGAYLIFDFISVLRA